MWKVWVSWVVTLCKKSQMLGLSPVQFSQHLVVMAPILGNDLSIACLKPLENQMMTWYTHKYQLAALQEK